MKFKVNREKLQKGLQRVGSVIGSRSTFPLLSNVLMKAEDGVLTLTASDLELRICTKVEAEVEVPGTTTAPAKKLTSLIASLSGEDVVFDVDAEDHIKLSCGTGRFKLLGLAASDYPEAVEFAPLREILIKENDFKRMIAAISYAVSVDDSRKVLTGVLFSVQESNLTLVSTDGKRMAMQEKSPESVNGTDGDAIVPLKAVSEVRRMLDGDGTISIKVGEKLCCFEAANFTLTSKLIEGSYPNYRQVVPASFAQSVEVPVSAFLSKIETLSLILSESSSYIILRFEENRLTLQASSSEVGDGVDFLELSYEGAPFEVSFNPGFLADPLRAVDAETIRMKLNDPLNPVAMEAGDGFLYVIMPIRKK